MLSGLLEAQAAAKQELLMKKLLLEEQYG